MKKLIKNKYLWIGVCIVAGSAYAFQSSSTEAVATGTTYETSPTNRGDITRSIASTGRVEALVTVEVGSQLSGNIEELHADFNDEVKKGQLVAKIDPQTFQQRVHQSQADLEAARANLAVQEATVLRANATLVQAQRDYDRQLPLQKDGAISEAALDATRAALESAKAGVQIAEAQVISAKASIKQREASLANAQIDLERTDIRSPIDGVIIERNVDQGQTVAASFSAPVLFKIAQDLKQIQIEASVDESDIGRVREGNEVTFQVDAHEGTEFTGTVAQVRLSPLELNNVVTYTVIINARNDRQLLLPGMTANMEIKTGQRSDVLRIPNTALRVRASDEMKAAQQAAQEAARPQGQRGGRGGARFAQMFEAIGASDEQRSAIQADMQQAMQSLRAQMQNGGDRSAMRDLFRARSSAVLKRHLTDEQYKKYEELQRQRAEIRRATVWVKEENGAIKAVPVRIGIADSSHTEVIGDNLPEGAEVITRVRKATQ
ncbi:efflux RND transporter periplasmic adaptor subunit [Kordiimonas sp. SCSIO 12603]|uniref:efflux RND transporter periplasmic adaptor subunit n=1 Tax=Kordiimonas sp. SCSIO 12603 TaxID=2829596 RepID=UPI00210309BF|nr:efflux RND transporter periplasmic adaptor subunit [Kordiimonas sp. SCSIO 12603]UTW60306.1 efflux RND transporter periplasmic adaptor subunit [Kordiimonas sp. SCSIO 12603]